MEPSTLTDEDSARLVVLGETSLLTTALVKSLYTQQTSYFYGGRSSLPSRMAGLSLAETEGDEAEDVIDDLMSSTDSSNRGYSSPSSSTPTLPTDPILKSLIRLKNKLRKGSKCAFSVTQDPSFLLPFCEIVKNKETDGLITGAALQSIMKFIQYGLVQTTESRGSVILIGESVTKARFVSNDSSTDEVVLMRILNVLRELIVRGFSSLSNEVICEIVQSCFRIAFEKRLSELLRRSAEAALTDIVRSLFLRLHTFPDSISNSTSQQQLNISWGSGVKIPAGFGKTKKDTSGRPIGQQTSINNQRMEVNSSQKSSPVQESLPSLPSPSQEVPPQQPPPPQPRVHEPHNIECILELLQYLISLINPLDGQNSDAMIHLGLNLLIISFESSVESIGRKKSLMSVVENDLCFNLIQLLQSTRPLTTFALALRLSFLIFITLRKGLKYQMETLITRLKDIITTQNAPVELRILSLEYLVSFFRHITFLPQELFFNYDLDPYASNLMEELFQFFSKNCFSSTSTSTDPSTSGPSTASTPAGLSTFTSMQLLSLDALLANLESLHRAEMFKDVAVLVGDHDDDKDGKNIPNDPEIPVPEDRDMGLPDNRKHNAPTNQSSQEVIFPTTLLELVHLKQRKSLLELATKEFNKKPKDGVKLLHKHSLVTDDKGIVRFLRDNQNVSKVVIGEFLAKKENSSLLAVFLESFDLKGLRVDEALRLFLETFRLPGEAPLVANILEPFANHWFVCNECPFENSDAAFTLAYAIIMLNVDQHNINVKRKYDVMTLEQFINNLRGVNGSKDFDPEMLKEIYEAIRSKEIVMPAEHEGPVKDRYLWKCLMGRAHSPSGVYATSLCFLPGDDGSTAVNPNGKKKNLLPLHLFNSQIFATLWGPTVAAMTFMFDRININHHSSLTQRILSNGFNSCALLCSSYGHLDNLIVILCKFTVSSSAGVSPLPSHKSQLAAQTLFSITREYANDMRDSWFNIVEIILHWFRQGFLDDQFVVDDFALNKKVFMRRRVKKKVTKNQEGTGILSSFYSYFAGSNPEIYEDTQREADASSVASTAGDVDSDNHSLSDGESKKPNQSNHIINTYCQPLSIIEESKFLHIDSLLELIKALINVNLELDEDEVGDDIEAFKLEMLLQITLLNRDRVPIFWDKVSNFILRALRSTAATPSDLISERAISAIFRLAIRFVPRPDETSDQVLLLLRQVLVTFEPSVIQKQCTALGLSSFITHCHSDIKRVDDWSLIFDYLLCIGIGCHPSDLPVRQQISQIESTPKVEDVPAIAATIPSSISQVEPDVNAVKIQIEDIIEDDTGLSCTPVVSTQDQSPPVETQVSSNIEVAENEVKPDDKPHASSPPPVPTDNCSEGQATVKQQQVKDPNNPSPPETSSPVSSHPSSLPSRSQPDPSEPTQPFIPGNSSVRDIEAYKKCVEVLTIVIKEILPKTACIQSNPRTDAEINQMAIDSLITLRFYSLHDERLRDQSIGKISTGRQQAKTSQPQSM